MSISPGAAPPSEAPASRPEATLVTVVAGALASAVRIAVEVQVLLERASGRAHPNRPDSVAPLVDATFDLTLRAAAVASGAAGAVSRLGRPVAQVALRPPILPSRLWPETRLAQMIERGRAARENADRVRAQVIGDLVVAAFDEVLDHIDLTRLVLDRVNVADIITTLDLDAIAARLDLAGLANQVIEEIDLPEIIRESSSAMASETVVGMRIRGIEADERVNRIVDRVLLRRRNPATTQLPEPDHG